MQARVAKSGWGPWQRQVPERGRASPGRSMPMDSPACNRKRRPPERTPRALSWPELRRIEFQIIGIAQRLNGFNSSMRSVYATDTKVRLVCSEWTYFSFANNHYVLHVITPDETAGRRAR